MDHRRGRAAAAQQLDAESGDGARTSAGLTRRDLFRLGALGAGVAAAGTVLPFGRSVSTGNKASTLSSSQFPVPYRRPLPSVPRLPYRQLQDADGPYRLYTVTQRAGNVRMLDSTTTPALGYGFQDAQGEQRLSVPGPLISVPQGTRVKLRVKNVLPETHAQWGHALRTSTHLHGSASLPQYDGYADDVTAPGQYKDYWYPNFQPARTLWYHDHGVHHTAQNVYSGLFAQYHLHDEAEVSLLPQGRYDVPLIIGDAMFQQDGSLAFQDDDHSGLWGDVVLVNGAPWPVMTVQRRLYRFRVLVAALSRSFTFQLVNTRTRQLVPVHVVATDGGLMPKTQTVTSWRQASAERYEVLVDFRAFSSMPAGSTFELRNTSNKNNRNYQQTGKIMQFKLSNEPVTETEIDTPWGRKRNPDSVPETLVPSTAMGLTANMASRTRKIDLVHDDLTNEFQINEQTWHDVQHSNYTLLVDGANPAVRDVEVWEIENKSGGWFHPLHVHLVDFRILSRHGGSGKVQPWEQGPKDVVYVGEGEIVRLVMKYEMMPGAAGAAGGRYMIHCHNLPHEDNDMMGQFQVGATPETNEPMRAAPARALPADGVYDEGPEAAATQL